MISTTRNGYWKAPGLFAVQTVRVWARDDNANIGSTGVYTNRIGKFKYEANLLFRRSHQDSRVRRRISIWPWRNTSRNTGIAWSDRTLSVNIWLHRNRLHSRRLGHRPIGFGYTVRYYRWTHRSGKCRLVEKKSEIGLANIGDWVGQLCQRSVSLVCLVWSQRYHLRCVCHRISQPAIWRASSSFEYFISIIVK